MSYARITHESVLDGVSANGLMITSPELRLTGIPRNVEVVDIVYTWNEIKEIWPWRQTGVEWVGWGSHLLLGSMGKYIQMITTEVKSTTDVLKDH